MDARALAIFAGLAAFGGVAWALSRSAASGPVDGVNWDSFDQDLLAEVQGMGDAVAAALDPVAEVIPMDLAQSNQHAFLRMVQESEGTAHQADPYRVVFGYGYTLQDLSDHPYFTGEWKGAPFGDGQWSTAAGAYQIIKKTWASVQAALQLPDFTPASQDAAALELIRRRGALEDVRAGRFVQAVHKVRREWASLPGAGYGQGERSLDWVAARYLQAGGQFA